VPEQNTALEKLHSRWEEIAARPEAELSTDQRRSLDFYLADVQRDESTEPHVRRWITMIHELDGFIRSHR
jgi:NAD(P)H-dependent FMN reductase